MHSDNINDGTDFSLPERSNFKTGLTIEELELDMTDDELKKLIKGWMSISAKSEGVIKDEGEVNKYYYIGVDIRTSEILDDKSSVTDNRIFTNTETIVPLVTSTPAKPIVFIPSAQGKNKKKKESIRDQAIKTQKVLLAIYDDLKMQQKYEKMYRQHEIYRIGMIKYGISDDKIFADVILPPRLLLDSEAVSIEDSEFVGVKIVTTAKKLIEKYPDSKDEISNKVQSKLGTKLTYVEWSTDEFTVIAIDTDVILDKKRNPLFDYTSIPETTVDEFGKEIVGEPTSKNFFDRPRKPFIAFNVYNIGENIIDETTPLILCKSLQDNINDKKRQIADNSDVAGNPIRTYTGFTKDQADEANESLRAGDGIQLAEGQSVSYVQATSLPAFVSNDLQDSRNAIDNIYGIHSTTRGERQGGESGRAREALREGDEDRQATIGRAIEQVSEELYNAFAHLIKVFYDKDQLIPIMGKQDAEDYISFKRDDIVEGMKIRVKPGSTIPEDKNSIKAQGLELAGMNRITNRRLYEMLGIDDAEDAVKELELEEVKAQQEQQELLAQEQSEQANQQTMQGFEEQIAQLGSGQAQ